MTMPMAGRRLTLVLAFSLAALAGCASTNRNIKQWSKAATSGTLEQFQEEIPQARSLIESLGPKPTVPEVVRLISDTILQALADFLTGHPLDQALVRLRDSLIAGIDLSPLERQLKPLLAELPRTLLESGRAFGKGFGEEAGRPFGRGFGREVTAITRDPEVRKALATLGHEVGREVALGVAEGLEQSLTRVLARGSPQFDARVHELSRQVTLGVLDGARADALMHQPGAAGAEGERPAAYYLGRETVRGTLDAGSGQLQRLEWAAVILGVVLVLGLLAGNFYLIVLLRRQTRRAPPAA
jgi:hypothetical protein